MINISNDVASAQAIILSYLDCASSAAEPLMIQVILVVCEEWFDK